MRDYLPPELPATRLVPERDTPERERRFAKQILDLIYADVVGRENSAYAKLFNSRHSAATSEAMGKLTLFQKRAENLLRHHLGITSDQGWDDFAHPPRE